MRCINIENQKFTAGIYTLGCKVNFYESEAISERLASNGIEICKFEDKCDIYVINTCTVTADSDRKALKVIRRALANNPDAIIAVTGCLAQRCPEIISEIKGVTLITGNENKISIADQIIELLSIEKPSAPQIQILPFSNVLESSIIDNFNRTRAYLKIEDGCSSKCAYCIIPKARGPVRSKPRNEILTEINSLALRGCKEIVFTGIEISSYQFDFIKLLNEASKIDGIERIRLGSLDPFFITKEISDSLRDIPKLCPHFHISLQSGSSEILAAMRRKYNAPRALENIKYLKSLFDDCNLFADVIVGFPGETENNFQETIDFIKDVEFLHLHIFPYSARIGTEAAEMKNQIQKNVKKERAARLSTIQSEIKSKILSEYVRMGKKTNVLFETYKNGLLKGHSENFIEFICPANKNYKGTITSVMPISTDGESISGYIIDEE